MADDTQEASPRGPLTSFALKHDDGFLVMHPLGDISGASDGLFRNDRRVLSQFTLRIGGRRPSLLGSALSVDNVLFRAHLTSRPLPELGTQLTAERVIHIERSRFLWQERLYERLVLTNYGRAEVPVPLLLSS